MANQYPSGDPPHKFGPLDSTFSAVATPARREILSRLREGPRTATDLWEGTGITKPSISKHLRILEEARLIEREKQGRTHWLRLSAQPMRPASDWLRTYERFWNDRLDSLEEFLLEGDD